MIRCSSTKGTTPRSMDEIHQVATEGSYRLLVLAATAIPRSLCEQQWNGDPFLFESCFQCGNATAAWEAGSNAPIRTVGGRNSRHGQRRVLIQFHTDNAGGCEGDRQRDILYGIPERYQLDLGERDYNGTRRPRTRDDRRRDHHGHAGHRASIRRQRICEFLGNRSDPVRGPCADRVKARR